MKVAGSSPAGPTFKMRTANITALIILIGLFIILYILLIPPTDRGELLEESSSEDLATQECINACKEATIDLSNGPCLWENKVEDYVCDVAHDPRQEIDNDPTNQCNAFREGRASHFVEVDESCGVIKVV